MMQPARWKRGAGYCGALLLLAFAATVACNRSDPPRDDLRLYVFDCGRIQLDSVRMFGLADEDTDVRELSVPCYVIEHPDGRLLWDGGLPSSLASTPGWQRDGVGGAIRLDRPLAEQLAALNLGMDAFDYVAFSHMHFDHVGVANELRGGTLLIQRAEHDAAFAAGATAPGFDPKLYEGLRAARIQLLDGDHDVFGDGRVRIIAAPGHTPGHQVLLVRLAETGPVLLSGDLYHFAASRELRRVPPFNADGDQTIASMQRVEDLLKETGGALWIEHELAHFERLKKAPEHYR
jgi:glyoxylase-like metal-dependent hydrolase (beta-lactamase superfamily II)